LKRRTRQVDRPIGYDQAVNGDTRKGAALARTRVEKANDGYIRALHSLSDQTPGAMLVASKGLFSAQVERRIVSGSCNSYLIDLSGRVDPLDRADLRPRV